MGWRVYTFESNWGYIWTNDGKLGYNKKIIKKIISK